MAPGEVFPTLLPVAPGGWQFFAILSGIVWLVSSDAQPFQNLRT